MTFFKAPSREPRRGGGSGKGAPTTPRPRKPIFPHPKMKHHATQFYDIALTLDLGRIYLQFTREYMAMLVYHCGAHVLYYALSTFVQCVFRCFWSMGYFFYIASKQLFIKTS